MAYLSNPNPDYSSVNEYIVAGIPWVYSGTTSGINVVKLSFPKVTKNFTVHNADQTPGSLLRVGFTSNGVNGVGENRYFLVDVQQVITFDARIKELFIRADTSSAINYSIFASLTVIDQKEMPPLTGSIGGTTYWTGVG